MTDTTAPGRLASGSRTARACFASRTRPLLVTLAILLSVVAAVNVLSQKPASAAGGTGAKKPVVTFGIQPATATSPDGRSYFSFNATGGGLIRDHVAVINYSYQPLSLRIHASDAVNTPEGDFALLPPNDPSPQFGAWVHMPLPQATVTVPARGTVIIPFSITVPQNADPGDHAGGILATLASYVASPSGQKIQLLQSVGSRIFVRVSGPLHPALTVENIKVDYQGTANPVGDGRAVLTYKVRNTGNVGLGGTQTVYVSGLFGSKTYAQKVPQVKLLLPGSSVRERVLLPKFFPELKMTAHVTISPLVLPGSVQPSSGLFRSDVDFWAVPWTLIAILVGILAVAVGSFVLRRRRRNRPSKGDPEPPAGPRSGSEGKAVRNKEQHMKVTSNVRRGAIALSVSVGVFSFPVAQAGASSSPPFTDQSAQGFIGFCDRNGQSIASGSVTDSPFVWTAVSSVPAPDGYAKGKALLAAYQPRQGIPPGEWSGFQMTASSSFTNALHPMAQATNGDPPLASFTGAYPPQWDGLVELRLYYSADNQPVHSTPYPATVIKISGDKWELVSGGKVSCAVGRAVSAETQIDPLGVPATAPQVEVNSHPAMSAPSKSGSPTTSPAGGTASSTPAAGAGSGTGTNASSSHVASAPLRIGEGSGGGGGLPAGAVAGIVAGGLALICGLAGLATIRRRRRAGA